MFTPHSLSIALLMMITSAICWGSWANTYKGVKNYRFELFYWDYAVGIFLISLILGHTMGSTSHDAESLVKNIHSASTNDVIFAMVGGAIFNLANLLLVAAIDMAGLAIAFPISIGIALVVGVITSYAQHPKGNATLLAAGVLCAVIAVVLDGKAYGSLPSASRSASRKSMDSRPLRRCHLPHTRCAALLLHLEHLLHEEAARRRPGQFRRFLPRPGVRPRPRSPRRIHLGHGNGFQSRRRQFHRCRDFLRHRAVCADGGGPVGRSCLEGIRRRRQQSEDLSVSHVRRLLPGNPSGGAGQRVTDFHATLWAF